MVTPASIKGLIRDIEQKRPTPAMQFRFGFTRGELLELRQRLDREGIMDGSLRSYLDQLLAMDNETYAAIAQSSHLGLGPYGGALYRMESVTGVSIDLLDDRDWGIDRVALFGLQIVYSKLFGETTGVFLQSGDDWSLLQGFVMTPARVSPQTRAISWIVFSVAMGAILVKDWFTAHQGISNPADIVVDPQTRHVTLRENNRSHTSHPGLSSDIKKTPQKTTPGTSFDPNNPDEVQQHHDRARREEFLRQQKGRLPVSGTRATDQLQLTPGVVGLGYASGSRQWTDASSFSNWLCALPVVWRSPKDDVQKLVRALNWQSQLTGRALDYLALLLKDPQAVSLRIDFHPDPSVQVNTENSSTMTWLRVWSGDGTQVEIGVWLFPDQPPLVEVRRLGQNGEHVDFGTQRFFRNGQAVSRIDPSTFPELNIEELPDRAILLNGCLVVKPTAHDPFYQQLVAREIRRISALPAGKQLLDDIVRSGHRVEIGWISSEDQSTFTPNTQPRFVTNRDAFRDESVEPNRPGAGSDSQIFFNPRRLSYRYSWSQQAPPGGHEMHHFDPGLILGHELIHAWRNALGLQCHLLDHEESETIGIGPVPGVSVQNAPQWWHTENGLRQDWVPRPGCRIDRRRDRWPW